MEECKQECKQNIDNTKKQFPKLVCVHFGAVLYHKKLKLRREFDFARAIVF